MHCVGCGERCRSIYGSCLRYARRPSATVMDAVCATDRLLLSFLVARYQDFKGEVLVWMIAFHERMGECGGMIM